MDPNQRRAKEIFHDALDAPESERARVVEIACRGDETLRTRVNALLSAHGNVGSFLSNATIGGVAELGSERAGTIIGRYKLLEKIGEGGFGVVWMAEQREPVSRRVALKVIKLGMDTKNVVARFEAERQALALMDHPNIAKVFDGGATDAGRPYFVMELVRGIPITEYCDKAKLSTDERLALFVTVCRAVQHAHQKGVIHRDIKPSNVLVTLQDGIAVAKVIDFGIAKATSAHLTERTLFTEFHQVIGTPEYMAPEQAEMSGLDVDTRADIYSLGVLLYELLTGTKPFDMRVLLDKGWDEILRTIRQVDPQKPSTRANSLGQRAVTIAAERRLDSAQFSRILRGDLDWIVMKALDKDRARRYQTATTFAEDIERHLCDEPVAARPPSTSYVLFKFLRRNRVAAVAGSAILIAILLGAGAATYGLFEARTERDRARTSETTAIDELRRRTQTALFLGEMLKGVGPSVALGRDTTILREILDTTEKRVETELGEQPEVAAALQDIIGDVYRQIGSFDAAVRAHRASLADWSRAAKPVLRDIATSKSNLALALVPLGQTDESERLQREVLAFWRAQPDPNTPDAALAANNLATMLITRGNARDEALKLLEEALAIWDAHPETTTGDSSLALGNLADIYLREHDAAKAVEYDKRALASLSKHFPKEHVRALTAQNNLAVALEAVGDSTAARDILRDVLARHLQVLGPKHFLTAQSYENLATIERHLGNRKGAEDAARAAAAIQDGLHAGDDVLRARIHALLGRILADGNKTTEAEKEMQFALDMRRRLFTSPDPSVVDSLMDLADLEFVRDDVGKAQRLLQEAVALARVTSGQNSQALGLALNSLGGAFRRQKNLKEARDALIEAFDILSACAQSTPADVAACGRNLAYTLTEAHEDAEAERLLTSVMPATRVTYGKDWAKLEEVLQTLITLRRRLKMKAEERETALEIVDNRRRGLPSDDARISEILNFAASTLHDLDDSAGAEQLAREALSRAKSTTKSDSIARSGSMVTLAGILADTSAVSKDPARATEAVELLREAVRVREELLKPDEWRLPFARVLLAGALAAKADCDTDASLDLRVANLTEAETLALAALDALEASKTLPAEVRTERLTRARRNVLRVYEVWNRIAPTAEKGSAVESWRARAAEK